jgi:hypothetical protein
MFQKRAFLAEPKILPFGNRGHAALQSAYLGQFDQKWATP